MGKILIGALALVLLVQPVAAQASESDCASTGQVSEPSQSNSTLVPSVDELGDSQEVLYSNEDDLEVAETVFSATSVSDNWAGYVTKPASGFTYRAVTARYVVPTITHSSSSACVNAAYGGWVGLGGFAAPRLAQVGLGAGNTAGSTYFFEMFCSSSSCFSAKNNFNQLDYQAGDLLEFTMIFNPTPTMSARSGVYTATVTNLSPNVGPNSFTTITTLSNALDYYDGTSADWIDEAPSNVSLGQLPLANFGQSFWTNAKVMDEQTRTWGSLGSEVETKVVMFSLSRLTVLASPSALSSTTSFSVTYLACR